MNAHDSCDLSVHVGYLLTRARHLTRNEADARDLVQDTLVRGLEALHRTGEMPMDMRAWLHVILRRLWFNVVRQRRSRWSASHRMADDGIDSSLVDTRASFSQFACAWKRLPESARRIATQCLLDEEPYDAVGGRVGLTKAAIATTIHRTRMHLKETMFGAS